MNRFNFSLSYFCTLTCLGLISCSVAVAAKVPNIIFILADDLGYGEVSFNGQTRYKTANIDRLAREGMVFTSAYAGSAICAPSRNTLMTGDHTGHATVRNNFAGGGSGGDRVALTDRDVTIARRLKEIGYTTGMFGKWGLGEPETDAAPWHEGWDSFYGFVNQAHAHNQFPEFLYRDSIPEPLADNFGHKESVFANDLFTAEALEFIEQSSSAKKPFFIYLSYTTPHADLRCPPDSIAEIKELYAWAREPDALDSSIIFSAMMHRLDRDVGRVMAKLKELGLDENTVVLFTGDNGAHDQDGKDNGFFKASGPYRGIKRDLYEGGIREPFFVRWPGRIAAGTTSDHILAFWDFSATALELAGQSRPVNLPVESISFAPTLLGRAADQMPHDHLYWELLVKSEGRQAVRRGPWKAVRNGLKSPVELYNLANDPGERTDLAVQQPGILKELAALLNSSRVENFNFPLKSTLPAKIKKPKP